MDSSRIQGVGDKVYRVDNSGYKEEVQFINGLWKTKEQILPKIDNNNCPKERS